jgi:hypothetical protein
MYWHDGVFVCMYDSVVVYMYWYDGVFVYMYDGVFVCLSRFKYVLYSIILRHIWCRLYRHCVNVVREVNLLKLISKNSVSVTDQGMLFIQAKKTPFMLYSDLNKTIWYSEHGIFQSVHGGLSVFLALTWMARGPGTWILMPSRNDGQ